MVLSPDQRKALVTNVSQGFTIYDIAIAITQLMHYTLLVNLSTIAILPAKPQLMQKSLPSPLNS